MRVFCCVTCHALLTCFSVRLALWATEQGPEDAARQHTGRIPGGGEGAVLDIAPGIHECGCSSRRSIHAGRYRIHAVPVNYVPNLVQADIGTLARPTIMIDELVAATVKNQVVNGRWRSYVMRR